MKRLANITALVLLLIAAAQWAGVDVPFFSKPEVPPAGRGVLFIYDAQTSHELPDGQAEIVGSVPFREWMQARSIRSRFWDDQQVIVGQDAETTQFATLFSKPRASLPWVETLNGHSGPMPATVADAKALLLSEFGLKEDAN